EERRRRASTDAIAVRTDRHGVRRAGKNRDALKQEDWIDVAGWGLRSGSFAGFAQVDALPDGNLVEIRKQLRLGRKVPPQHWTVTKPRDLERWRNASIYVGIVV